MKTSNGKVIALLLGASMIAACEKDAEEIHSDLVNAPTPNTIVAMSMSYTRAGAPFDKSVAFQDAAGTWIRVDRIKFYISQPWFEDDGGDTVAAFPAKHLLVDLDDGGTYQTIGELSGHLHRIHFGLGVDSTTNHGDPLTFVAPLDEPGMWWTWTAGFKFLVLEGVYDSDGDGTVEAGENEFIYHCGFDTLYTPVNIEVHTEASTGGNVVLPFDLNIDSLMAGMDVLAAPVVQDVTPVTTGLMQRLAAGLTHVE